MNKKLKWLWSCFAALLIVVTLGKSFHIFKHHKKHRPRSSFTTVTEEKPFVVIIPSYNNSAFCERNLQSVLTQHYNNYRVIYIDDCSKDDTYPKVQGLISKYASRIKVELIHNEQNRGALANLHDAIHKCKNNEIVVTVDGDDYLAHEEVLAKLNKVYANSHVWMTYGNFLDYPTYTQKPVTCKKTPKKVIQNNSFRNNEWVTSHLRTFYAGLFKQVRLQDLIYKGHFLPMAWDLGFMMPMLEMAGKHACFVKEVLYLYNRVNPLNDHIINFPLQEECARHVRKLPRYSRLKTSPANVQSEDNLTADMVIFSFDRPLQLYACLESVKKYISNLNAISLIYRCSNEEFERAYRLVQRDFSDVKFIKQSDCPHEDFKSLVMQTAFTESLSDSMYLIFAVDDVIVKDYIDLAECIQSLQKTGAYGFYLSHGTNLNYCYTLDCAQQLPPNIRLDNQVRAWQFKNGEADWRYQNSLDLVLYRKKDVEKDFAKLSFTHPNSLEHLWNLRSKLNRVGLFYAASKCVNIPLNQVNPSQNKNMQAYSPQELLKKFQDGQKIDISALHDVANNSRHIEYTPIFIER